MRTLVITGPDGSGKSTLCKRLQNRLENLAWKTREISIWDAMNSSLQAEIDPSVALPFKNLKETVSYLGDLKSSSRQFFLMHSMARAIEQAEKLNLDLLIINSHWYKYFLSEVAYGLSFETHSFFASFFKPADQTFFLDIQAETALARKQELSNYEKGGKSGGQESFLKIQKKIYPLWMKFSEIYGPWTVLSALDEPLDLENQVFNHIQPLLRSRPHEPSK